jgi:hypothetical protein
MVLLLARSAAVDFGAITLLLFLPVQVITMAPRSPSAGSVQISVTCPFPGAVERPVTLPGGVVSLGPVPPESAGPL